MVVAPHGHQQCVLAGQLFVNWDLLRFVAAGVDLQAVEQWQDLFHQVLVGHQPWMGMDRQPARRVDGLDRLLRRRDRGIEIGGHEIDGLAHAIPGVSLGHQAVLENDLEDGARHHGWLVRVCIQAQVAADALLPQDPDPCFRLFAEHGLRPLEHGEQRGVIQVDSVAEDVPKLVGGIGRDLERRDIAEAAAVGDGAGPVHPEEGVVVGQRHYPDPFVGGEVGHLVGVAPAVTHRRMHVEVGQHGLSLPGTSRLSAPARFQTVTVLPTVPVENE